VGGMDGIEAQEPAHPQCAWRVAQGGDCCLRETGQPPLNAGRFNLEEWLEALGAARGTAAHLAG
jgi:hypothetical protein